MKKTLFTAIFAILVFFAVSVNAQEYLVKIPDNGQIKLMGEPAERVVDNIFKANNEAELNELLEKYDVEEYQPNYTYKLFYDVNDPLYKYGYQWNLTAIKASAMWDKGVFGNNVKIGIIDSGINPYLEIASNVVPGYNFTDDTTETSDDVGHGTFISGVIAAKINNGVQLAGVADKVQLVPLKCFKLNYDTSSEIIIKAINKAVNEYGCSIINISSGGEAYDDLYFEEIKKAVDKGVIVCVSVGNDGADETKKHLTYYPAGFSNTIGVGSIDKTLVVSDFSQKNNSVFVVAPGSEIVSCANETLGYRSGSGTSYAAPHVAAVAAMVKSINPNITQNEFMQLLQQTSTDIGTVGYDTSSGWGVVNCQAILNKIMSQDNFISPVSVDGNEAKFYLNTKTSANIIYATYDENKRLKKITKKTASNGFNTATLDGSPLTKLFVWQSLGGVNPVTLYREITQ